MRKILSPDGLLPFNARAMQGVYGVLWQYSRTQTTIAYEMDLQFNGYSKHGLSRLLLHRKKMFVGNPPKNGKIYTLIAQLAGSIYPLHLCLNEANELVEVMNRADVVRRSGQIVNTLWEYYPDEPARRCFELFKTDIASPNLAKAVENDLFFQLCFYPLHATYSASLTAEATIKLPVNGRFVPFSATATLTLPDEVNQKIEINLNGQCPGRLRPNRFSARYFLFADDHSISSIKGTLQYDGLDGLPCNQTFEVYRLDPEKRIPARTTETPRKKTSVFIGVDDRPPPAAKGLWNIFN